MKALKLLLVAVRVTAWILVTGAFWAIVLKLPTHPVIADTTAVALFFLCYALTPRIGFMEKTP